MPRTEPVLVAVVVVASMGVAVGAADDLGSRPVDAVATNVDDAGVGSARGSATSQAGSRGVRPEAAASAEPGGEDLPPGPSPARLDAVATADEPAATLAVTYSLTPDEPGSVRARAELRIHDPDEVDVIHVFPPDGATIVSSRGLGENHRGIFVAGDLWRHADRLRELITRPESTDDNAVMTPDELVTAEPIVDLKHRHPDL